MPVPQGLIQRLMQYAGKNKDIVGNVSTGSALTSAFGLFTGGPKAAAAYGAADFLAAYPATLLARKAGEKITKPIKLKLKEHHQGSQNQLKLQKNCAHL